MRTVGEINRDNKIVACLDRINDNLVTVIAKLDTLLAMYNSKVQDKLKV